MFYSSSWYLLHYYCLHHCIELLYLNHCANVAKRSILWKREGKSVLCKSRSVVPLIRWDRNTEQHIINVVYIVDIKQFPVVFAFAYFVFEHAVIVIQSSWLCGNSLCITLFSWKIYRHTGLSSLNYVQRHNVQFILLMIVVQCVWNGGWYYGIQNADTKMDMLGNTVHKYNRINHNIARRAS